MRLRPRMGSDVPEVQSFRDCMRWHLANHGRQAPAVNQVLSLRLIRGFRSEVRGSRREVAQLPESFGDSAFEGGGVVHEATIIRGGESNSPHFAAAVLSPYKFSLNLYFSSTKVSSSTSYRSESACDFLSSSTKGLSNILSLLKTA